MLATTLALLLVLVQAARAAPNGASPLKVFVLAGQSNMEGQAEVRETQQSAQTLLERRCYGLCALRVVGFSLSVADSLSCIHCGCMDRLIAGEQSLHERRARQVREGRR